MSDRRKNGGRRDEAGAHCLSLGVACLIANGAITGAAADVWPNSWSCSNGGCTGVYTSTGGTQYYSIGMPFSNVAPDTEFREANAEFTEFEPNALNCDVDEKAVVAALAIKKAVDTDGLGNNNQNQTEYGAIIGQVGPDVKVGTIVQGTSYNQSPPATTDYLASWSSLRIPYSATVGVIHYHPWHNSASVREQNKRPSPGDLAQADGLVAQGANPSRLTLYVIDNAGTLRAYSYVPASQRTSTYPPPRSISTGC